jgi:hypothetical protein
MDSLADPGHEVKPHICGNSNFRCRKTYPFRGWRCISMVECLPSMGKDLGSIPKKERRRKGGREEERKEGREKGREGEREGEEKEERERERKERKKRRKKERKKASQQGNSQ